jgi:pimeloyl-ACP methyl ester carboxylesterase
MKTLSRRVTGFITALLLMSGTCLLSGCGDSSASPNATVVLVHGAWADGSSWSGVIPLLQAKGLKVVAVQQPRSSIPDDVATVTRAIDAQTGPVILVGHSFGGAVITQAGNDPKVVALVYVSAFAPNDGQSVFDVIAPFPAPSWTSQEIQDSAGYISLSPAAISGAFAPDVSASEAALLTVVQAPLAARCFTDKITTAAWKTKPSWWIYGDQDQIIPAALQQAVSKAINATTTVIPGASHVTLIAHPDAVATVILDAAAKTGNL